ncbi:MAG: hypothetical protein HY683_06535, partial [Chloroflexi bacterium]|nr:hypothetical protein [Chloroflexota bacterium]
VVAYSTISQLGYMMLALGVGAYAAAIFHLFNHAFFKALLFLGSGSANHATGTFNMRYMGGLRRYMPWTYGTFLIAALSLAGIFPLAGFWSKDEVLAEALGGGHPVSTLAFVLAVVAVPMTAFYIFRALFMTFHGEFRGGAPAEEAALAGSQHGNPHPAKAVAATGKRRKRRSRRREAAASAGHGGIHLAESPWVMVLPMLALAVLAIGSGFIANSPIPLVPVPEHWFSGFLVVPGGHAEAAPFNLAVAVGSTLLALGGISVAWLLYGARKLDPAKVTVKPLYTLLTRKYYMDDLYEKVVVGKLFYRGLCATLEWFDGTIVDGAVDGVGWLGRNLGKALARLQTGEVQAYGAGISLGLLVILIAYLVWR